MSSLVGTRTRCCLVSSMSSARMVDPVVCTVQELTRLMTPPFILQNTSFSTWKFVPARMSVAMLATTSAEKYSTIFPLVNSVQTSPTSVRLDSPSTWIALCCVFIILRLKDIPFLSVIRLAVDPVSKTQYTVPCAPEIVAVQAKIGDS
jgi:hypothetical protein